ncbi:DMT family transporter [Evansella tamaricis]|uniref:DMT family transporter n=1 Tax=Evansella tamaricis TaxID=2069301 RepID=A0ABS6JHJ5_9BACI|nr:DMT family transporter [Evansella tamaricis]MBU9713149.1 DMT family transporter [Evansella tamaricis]
MRFHPYILLSFAMLFFSGNFIVGKAFEGIIPPFTLALFRFSSAILLLLPFCYKTLKLNIPLWKQEWRPLVGLSVFGIVLFNSCLYLSVNYTSSINAAIVDALTPTVAIILGFFLLKEKMTKLQLCGVSLSFAGILWIITKGSLDVLITLSFNAGDLIMLLGIIFWAIYSIIIKVHSHKFPSIAGLVVTMIIGCVILLPMALMEWFIYGFPYLWEWKTILGILYIGIFPSALALAAWYKGVGQIGPAKASVFFNLVPVFTTILAILFLGEMVSYHQLIGGFIVLLGVYLSTKK